MSLSAVSAAVCVVLFVIRVFADKGRWNMTGGG